MCGEEKSGIAQKRKPSGNISNNLRFYDLVDIFLKNKYYLEIIFWLSLFWWTYFVWKWRMHLCKQLFWYDLLNVKAECLGKSITDTSCFLSIRGEGLWCITRVASAHMKMFVANAVLIFYLTLLVYTTEFFIGRS